MTEFVVTLGVSHPEVPGMTFCTVDGGTVNHPVHGEIEHDTRYLADLNSAMHFLVGNHLKFGDTIRYAGESETSRELKVDKVIRGDRICYDVGGVGLPDGITELFNPEDLILWLSNVLQPGDVVTYLED